MSDEKAGIITAEQAYTSAAGIDYTIKTHTLPIGIIFVWVMRSDGKMIYSQQCYDEAAYDLEAIEAVIEGAQ